MYMYVFVYTCTCMHYMCACDNVNPVELYWTRCTRVVAFEVNPLLHNSVVYRNTCTHEHNSLVPATELMVHRRNPTLHQCVHAYARRASCGLTIIIIICKSRLTYVRTIIPRSETRANALSNNTISVLLHVCLDGTTRPFQPYQPGVLPERPLSELLVHVHVDV